MYGACFTQWAARGPALGSPCECAAGRDRGANVGLDEVIDASRARRLAAVGEAVQRDLCSAFAQARSHAPHEITSLLHAISSRGKGGRVLRSIGTDAGASAAHQASQKPLSQRMPIAVDYTRPPRQQRCSREREPIILIAKASCAHFFCKRCKDKRQSKKDLPRAPQQRRRRAPSRAPNRCKYLPQRITHENREPWPTPTSLNNRSRRPRRRKKKPRPRPPP